MYGTYANVIAVIIGSIIGVILHRKFTERIKQLVFHGVGLVVLFLGVQMALKTANLAVLIFSVLVGAVVGEALEIDRYFHKAGNVLRSKSSFVFRDEKLSEGIITAFIIFCVGAMSILGAIEDGLNNDPSILYAKSMLDGFTSIALASIFGIGVLLSVIPLFIFQGGLTMLAAYSKAFFTSALINELSAVGGILLIASGLNILEIKKIKVVNLLPALFVVILLVRFIP